MADRYWVGGTGNWDASTTTNWSASSGGAGGASVPTSADNVIFDSLSNATAYTVTITATANCLDFTMAGPLVGAVTWAGSSALNIYGSLNLSGGVAGITRTYTGSITFRATSGTRTITSNSIALGSSVIFNGYGGTFQLADGFTLSSATNMAITAGTFDANGQTVSLISTDHTLTGNFTFFNLTRTGTSSKTCTFTIGGDQTVSGTLTINGNSSTNRLLVKSSTLGTVRTLTAATVSVSNADFQDITGAGAGSWDLSAITGNSGDCGGNSGITFTTPATTDCSAGTTWSTATWSSRVPLPQDTATFSGAGRTITQDMPRIGSVNFTGSSGLTFTPTLSFAATSFYGSINLTDLGTLTSVTGNYIYEGRGVSNMYCAGKSWGKQFFINSVSGELIFQDDFANTSSVTLTSGTLSANNVSVSISAFASSVANNRVINMGSGTWSLTNTGGSVWNISNYTNLTINEQSSTIKFTGALTGDVSFQGGGNVFNNFWNATTNAFSCIIVGSNTFNDFKSDVARTNKFTAGTTQHVTTFTVNGTAGNEVVLDSTTTATYALVKDGGGTITCDYLNIQHSVATPALTWLATNSTNNQATATAGSGWYFDAFPLPNQNFFMLF